MVDESHHLHELLQNNLDPNDFVQHNKEVNYMKEGHIYISSLKIMCSKFKYVFNLCVPTHVLLVLLSVASIINHPPTDLQGSIYIPQWKFYWFYYYALLLYIEPTIVIIQCVRSKNVHENVV